MAHPSAHKATFTRGHKAKPEPQYRPENFRPSFNNIWNRWLASRPGTIEAVELAAEIRRRHEENGLECVELRVKGECQNGFDDNNQSEED